MQYHILEVIESWHQNSSIAPQIIRSTITIKHHYETLQPYKTHLVIRKQKTVFVLKNKKHDTFREHLLVVFTCLLKTILKKNNYTNMEHDKT